MLSNQSMFPAIYFRRATLEDLPPLHVIWMQKHVLPFMAFEEMSQEQFKPIFEHMLDKNAVYVAVQNDEIIGVRKISYTGHTAYLGAFAVKEGHTNKKLGTQFYEVCLKKIAKRKEIIRVELSFENDNPIAPILAKKMGFGDPSLRLPDWLQRKTGDEKYRKKWLTGECFVQFLFEVQPITLPQISAPLLPQLNSHSMHFEGKKLPVITFTPGEKRWDHIQFCMIELLPETDLAVAANFLRQELIRKVNICKKIEITTHDEAVIRLLEKLGCYYRGELIANFKEGDHYYNEAVFDISFFNTDDAIAHADFKDYETYLVDCHAAIKKDWDANKIDSFFVNFLENLAFQMVREKVGEAFYTPENAPWQTLLDTLLDNLDSKEKLIILASKLGSYQEPDDYYLQS